MKFINNKRQPPVTGRISLRELIVVDYNEGNIITLPDTVLIFTFKIIIIYYIIINANGSVLTNNLSFAFGSVGR